MLTGRTTPHFALANIYSDYSFSFFIALRFTKPDISHIFLTVINNHSHIDQKC
jgi:hypothetical protein